MVFSNKAGEEVQFLPLPPFNLLCQNFLFKKGGNTMNKVITVDMTEKNLLAYNYSREERKTLKVQHQILFDLYESLEDIEKWEDKNDESDPLKNTILFSILKEESYLVKLIVRLFERRKEFKRELKEYFPDACSE
jgi:hypothetical protein